MLCFETGVCEHINKCFFSEDNLCGGVRAGCGGGRDQILSSLPWGVAEKVVTLDRWRIESPHKVGTDSRFTSLWRVGAVSCYEKETPCITFRQQRTVF